MNATRRTLLALPAATALALCLSGTAQANRTTAPIGYALAPMQVSHTCGLNGLHKEALQQVPMGGAYGAATTSGTRRGSSRGLGSRGTGAGGGGSMPKAMDDAPSYAPAAPAPVKAKKAEREASVAFDAVEEQEAPMARSARDEDGIADASSGKDARRQRPPVDVGPAIDFGGTTYLSNDDTSSLASPQRLLWALERGAGISLDQIRPHELLNYFSFTSAAPTGNDTFEVTVSAEQTDASHLQLALSVQGATPSRAPLDLTFLIDRSGSMSSEGRMAYTKRALHQAVGNLVPGDRVDLVVFDSNPCTPLQSFVVGRDPLNTLTQTINAIQPRGSTDLDAGLHHAYRLTTARADRRGRMGNVMVFTDAELNTGDVNPHTVSQIAKHWDADGVRLTGVGVGSSFRDDVLNMLTEKGKGAYVFLGSDAVVDRLFGQGFDSLVQTIAHNVRFQLDLPNSLGMEKFYGEESSTVAADVQPVSFHAGAQQLFFQDLAIHPRGLSPHETVQLTVSWDDPQSGARRSQRFDTTLGSALSADPRNVRKARALMSWSDVLTARAVGADACGQPWGEFWADRAALGGDAELDYAAGLMSRVCGEPVYTPPPVAYNPQIEAKVRIDSDMAVQRVDLSCGSGFTNHQSRQLTGSDSVVRFMAEPGDCQVTLQGVVPMTASVQLPTVDADVRCTVRAGRMQCN